MSSIRHPLPLGFRWSSAKAGIKSSGRPDLAIAVCDTPAAAAVLFTRNQVVAAPIIVGREHMQSTGGSMRAVMVNAGNANCATGPEGLQSARTSCETFASLLSCEPQDIFPSSTGIIGVPLPVGKLIAALPAAVVKLESTPAAAEAFATAILTTDTRMKTAQAEITMSGKPVRLFGCCKGAGMIGPDVGPTAGPPHATMLVYLFTDLRIDSPALQPLLEPAADITFNSISVDGDTSTNDTVLLLASGASNAGWSNATADEQTTFRSALTSLCNDLVYSVIDDGEGVTHVITLHVSGAPTHAAAKQIARTVANSPLCKTAWSSADPNWGRILAAAGRAGVPFDPAQTSIHIAGLPVFEHGTRSPHMDEAAVHTAMTARHYDIQINIGSGPGTCRFLTCDLTVEYIHINADYST